MTSSMNAMDIFFGLFEKGNENIPTHIEHVLNELTFHDLLIDTKTTQKFTNRSKTHVELEYKYRSDCAPHFMEVTLYDPETQKKETLRAKIHTKQAAVEKYDDALADGNRGVLMEKDENVPNLFVLSLGNIKPGMEIEIVTRVVRSASLETDEEDCDKVNFTTSIPALTPDDGINESEEARRTMEVRINAAGASSVSSPSHDDSLTALGGGRWKTSEKVSVTREFEVMVTYSKYPFSTLTVSRTNFKNYKYSGILTLMPNFAAQPVTGHELILIIDCSGSMSGSRMKCAVETLKLFMQSLDADRRIKYNIIRFGSQFNTLFPESVELKDDENFEKAKEYVRKTNSNMGGTNMLQPIQSLFSGDGSRKLLDDFFASPPSSSLANSNKGKDEKLRNFVDQNICTYKLSGKEYMFQKWYHCAQCGLSESTGCCESCAKTCHRGHRGLQVSSKSPSNFFCDCGANPHGTCQSMKKELDPFFNDDPFKTPPAHEEEEEEYVKQLFLFTDGEDSYPSQIESLVARKHKEVGLRVFSFGIGRGINRSFLQNVADLTKGSACFIEDIREEMKAQVMRQLSNAFRTSIDSIHITKGLSESSKHQYGIEKADNSSGKIPLIFNGRSYHQYYFMEKLPEEIEVQYSFLGIQTNEAVEIRVLKDDDEQQQQEQQEQVIDTKTMNSAISVRVANEFVKGSCSQKRKEIEELGLHFQIPTDHTSFFLESESKSTVVSEMKVEQVQSTVSKAPPSRTTSSSSNYNNTGTSLLSFHRRVNYTSQPPPSALGWGSVANNSGGGGGGGFGNSGGGGYGAPSMASNTYDLFSPQYIQRQAPPTFNGSTFNPFECGEVRMPQQQQQRQQRQQQPQQQAMMSNPQLFSHLSSSTPFHRNNNNNNMNNNNNNNNSNPFLENNISFSDRRSDKNQSRRKRRGRVNNTNKRKLQQLKRKGKSSETQKQSSVDSFCFFDEDTSCDMEESESSSGKVSQMNDDILSSFEPTNKNEKKSSRDNFFDDLFSGGVESSSKTTVTKKAGSSIMDISHMFGNQQQQHPSQKPPQLQQPQPQQSVAKKMRPGGIRDSISSANLSQLLLLSDMRGLWKVNTNVLSKIGFSSREEFLRMTSFDNSRFPDENAWLTAVILAILNRFYRSRKREWNLIYKKSEKNLAKLWPGIIAEAKKVV